MRIRLFNFRHVIFYESFINPVMWIVIAWAIIYTVFFSWIGIKTINVNGIKYTELVRNKKDFVQNLKDMRRHFFLLCLNTIWFNNKRSRLYWDYLNAKYYTTIDDYGLDATPEYKKFISERMYKKYLNRKHNND